MLDLSKIEDLKPLARLIFKLGSVCPDTSFVIAGAQARDLHLKYGYDIDTARRTADVDFAFRVRSWKDFHRIRADLLASGDFQPFPKTLHKLKFGSTLEVDFVPFGGIETAGRTIEWPPDQSFAMSTFGFDETSSSTIEVALPEGRQARVVSLAALALLKLEAWKDRRLTQPGKDAHDLRLIFTNYLNAGNAGRIDSEFAYLLTGDFDYRRSGAHVLGFDIAHLLDDSGRARVRAMLAAESDPGDQLRLVTDMKLDFDEGVALLTALLDGFDRAMPHK